MSDVASIAAYSTSVSQSRVADAIGIKMLKLANDQQKSVANLLQGALDQATQLAEGVNGEGTQLDVLA
ncbi:MAG: putative motility protein [Phycisphaerae bacterium]